MSDIIRLGAVGCQYGSIAVLISNLIRIKTALIDKSRCVRVLQSQPMDVEEQYYCARIDIRSAGKIELLLRCYCYSHMHRFEKVESEAIARFRSSVIKFVWTMKELA